MAVKVQNEAIQTELKQMNELKAFRTHRREEPLRDFTRIQESLREFTRIPEHMVFGYVILA